MAGLDAPLRPAAFSSATAQPSFSSRIVLLLAVLPLALACLAFVLQWRGGLQHPSSRWPTDTPMFLGTENSPLGSSLRSSPSSSDCTEILGNSSSPSFPFYRGWNFDFDPDPRPKICITTSTSASLEQILPWLYYHKVIGVTNFFLFVEGQAAKPNVSAVLESIPGVKVIDRTSESEAKRVKSRFWNQTSLSDFFYKSCNYGLFLKQSLNMERAIVLARDAGVDWIIHLDTDELIHPAGAQEYSLRQLLSDVPGNVDMVIFPNYESCIERDDIQDPFTEVSMFKKNYDHLPKETYFSLYKEATRGNPYYFLTYINGKSAARVQEYLRPNGAHRWHNYKKTTPNEIKLEEAAILHYTYAKFSDLASRRDRCDCKPTKDDVKRCFILEFDREAFMIASTATKEEMLRWFRERVVWTDKQLIWKLLRKGVLTRIYTPMAIIRGLKESGVFTSAVVSAKTLNREKFLSSVESPQKKNSSVVPNLRAGVSQSISTSTLRRSSDGESQATARRILELASVHNKAIPLMSPPWLG